MNYWDEQIELLKNRLSEMAGKMVAAAVGGAGLPALLTSMLMDALNKRSANPLSSAHQVILAVGLGVAGAVISVGSIFLWHLHDIRRLRTLQRRKERADDARQLDLELRATLRLISDDRAELLSEDESFSADPQLDSRVEGVSVKPLPNLSRAKQHE